MVVKNGGYAWAAFESLRYHAILRRRLSFGLVDLVICNRLLLWGIMSLCVLTGLALNSIASHRSLAWTFLRARP